MSAPPALDPSDRGFIDDPYPMFAELRALGEVHHVHGLGLTVAVSHAACSALLRDRKLGRVWVDAQPVERFTAFNLLHRNSLLEREPPSHTRLRRLVAGAFGRGHTERLRPRIAGLAERLVDELVGRIATGGRGELIETVAAPLPVEVIAELLDVPAGLRPTLRPWSNTIVKMYEYGLDDAGRRAAEEASGAFVAALRELAAHRRRSPGDDLVSDLLVAGLTEDELVGTAALLLMAGHEATVNAVGNGTLALLRNPAEWQRLRSGSVPVQAAVEELIRFDSPLQLFERTATADVELGGRPIRAGEKVAALLGAAARDPAVFADPDRLDLSRQPNPHLGFGAGIHYCLGAPLARVEVAAVLDALRTRLPGLAPAGPPVRRPEFVIRGLRELWVTG
jgi:cytochrome P450